METMLGKFTKLSTKSPLHGSESTPSVAVLVGDAETNSNLRGKLVRLRSRCRFSASIFRRTAPFPRTWRGVADCESFHGGQERKSGPLKGMIQLEKGERNLEE